MSLAKPDRVTADEFLPWAMRQPERYELVDGRIVRAMTGARQSHSVVVANIVASFVPQLKRSGCRTTASDTAVRTSAYGIRYPDVVIDCGPSDPSALAASEPRIIVEVTSRSTSAIDATDKLDEYKALASVQAIVLVEPDVVSVKVYRRAGGRWTAEWFASLDDSVPFPEVGAVLSLSDLYDTLEPGKRPPLQPL